MKLKRFALKGLAILALVLALCAFFSGTVRTITTAKVKLTSGKMGKLEEKIEITANIAFLETEEIKPALSDGATLTILQVNTRAGYTAAEGETLICAEVTGYAESVAEQKKAYEDAENGLVALQKKNRDLRIRQADEEYVNAYTAYKEAKSAEMLSRISMETLLGREGLALDEDGGAPEGASEKCAAAVKAHAEASEALVTAKAAYDKNSRYSISDEALSFLTERNEYQAKMDEAEAKMRALSELNGAAAEIVAPHSGYVTSVSAKVGDVYDGKTALCEISAADCEPVFKSDVTDVERTVSKGATVTIQSSRWGYAESRVNSVETGTDGRKYAYIDYNEDVSNMVGSVYTLMQAEQAMTLSCKSKDATCLVPSSAVHGAGDERYVFTVNKLTSTFGAASMTVTKRGVKVLSEVDGVASLEEDISYFTIAYMEDRTLNDGDAVMEYSN